jgi:gamma-glutamyltranspeptidase/glutathione hydrolase
LLLSPIMPSVVLAAQAPEAATAARPPGAAVASAHALATDAGLEILRQGGNAFDAAVAVSSVLSVVEPISSGLGGGGFFLLHDAKTGQDHFIDAREIAPAASTATAPRTGRGPPAFPDCLRGWCTWPRVMAACR